jgi:three-Cys-motif partner protein
MPNKGGYVWDPNGSPPPIEPHSIAKLEVLREYLLAYFQTLVMPGQDRIRLTFVDGFSGGGMYRNPENNVDVFGSPLVMLQAAREAEFAINIGRQKPFEIDAQYFFIDHNKAAIASLDKVLRERGYSENIDKDIKLLRNTFTAVAKSIRDAASERSPRAGRAIFFLDQYGYTDVPAPEIREIFNQLPAAEVILTFNVDSFINFISDLPNTEKIMGSVGIPDALKGRSIKDIKSKESDFRLYIQSCLYPELVAKCGAKFYTVFFIRTSGHGDYWLVHLSQHQRARDVMTGVHWAKNNYFIHYGGAGINMFDALGYAPGNDASLSGQEFLFDNPAAKRSVDALMEQLPKLIYARPEGYVFAELFGVHCNTTPADSPKFKEALAALAELGEIEIVGREGENRRRTTYFRQHNDPCLIGDSCSLR